MTLYLQKLYLFVCKDKLFLKCHIKLNQLWVLMQCSLISSYFHDFIKEQTMMLKVFPDDDLGSRHDRVDMSGRSANSAPNNWRHGRADVSGRPTNRGRTAIQRISRLEIETRLPHRQTTEASSCTRVMIAPSALHPGLTDAGQSTLTPDRYKRLLTDPGLTPSGHIAP
ncbi:hypothetical protein B296_00007272 [Ensete ventricosum]|uniref:Uncharacterized protein n=1 Tax=Ensete ventricosum TaxID=4639 RepID=A0A427AUN8_ENSVE|nr:hypothetical protein B296_00007272 [Ensete ventricosum]